MPFGQRIGSHTARAAPPAPSASSAPVARLLARSSAGSAARRPAARRRAWRRGRCSRAPRGSESSSRWLPSGPRWITLRPLSTQPPSACATMPPIPRRPGSSSCTSPVGRAAEDAARDHVAVDELAVARRCAAPRAASAAGAAPPRPAPAPRARSRRAGLRAHPVDHELEVAAPVPARPRLVDRRAHAAHHHRDVGRLEVRPQLARAARAEHEPARERRNSSFSSPTYSNTRSPPLIIAKRVAASPATEAALSRSASASASNGASSPSRAPRAGAR